MHAHTHTHTHTPTHTYTHTHTHKHTHSHSHTAGQCDPHSPPVPTHPATDLGSLAAPSRPAATAPRPAGTPAARSPPAPHAPAAWYGQPRPPWGPDLGPREEKADSATAGAAAPRPQVPAEGEGPPGGRAGRLSSLHPPPLPYHEGRTQPHDRVPGRPIVHM